MKKLVLILLLSITFNVYSTNDVRKIQKEKQEEILKKKIRRAISYDWNKTKKC